MRKIILIAAFLFLIIALWAAGDPGFSCFGTVLLVLGFFYLLKKPQPASTTPSNLTAKAAQGRSGATTAPSPGLRARKAQPEQVRVTVSYQTSESSFIKQAKQLVNHREPRADHVPFQAYWSTYNDMNRNQKRWYFYWRDQVRHGHYPDTSLSYVFVHVYELINNIGAKNPLDGYKQLRTLWMHYREAYPNLDHYLVDWITDYIIVNRCPIDPLSLYAELPVQESLGYRYADLALHYYLDRSLKELPLFVLDALTDYNIRRSRFYQSRYRVLLESTLQHVLAHLNAYLHQKSGKGIFEKYQPRSTSTIRRKPFRSAVYEGRADEITIAEVYSYSNHKPLRQFLTGVVKYTENALRQREDFSGRLRVPSLKAEVTAVIDQAIKQAPQPRAAEYVIGDEQTQSARGIAVPTRPPSPVPSKADVDRARAYRETAQRLADRVEKSAKPAPLESPFTGYSHDYQNLSAQQRRWYFYWRNQVREGNYLPTDLGYVIILANELLHQIGARDAADAYRQLRELWLNYREQHPKTEPYLLGWITSFASKHECAVSPQDVLTQPEAHHFTLQVAPDLLLVPYTEGRPLRKMPLELLDQFVDHDIPGSSFYTAGYESLLQRMLPATVEAVNRVSLKSRGKSLFDLYQPAPLTIEVKNCWRASQTYPDWPTQLTFGNVPSFSQHDPFRQLLTGIVKHTENKLREEKEHRGRLRVDNLDDRTAELIDLFLDRMRQKTAPSVRAQKVEIDIERVRRLRAESEEVLELLLDDEEERVLALRRGTEPEQASTLTSAIPEPTLASEGDSPAHVEFEDEAWSTLATRLSDQQVQALGAIINAEDAGELIHQLAAEHSMMPTMLLDSINELAQDLIGDILIETDPAPRLSDEYYEPLVAKIVGSN